MVWVVGQWKGEGQQLGLKWERGLEIPVLGVRRALVALLGPWDDRAWSYSPDFSSSPIHSLSFREAWLWSIGKAGFGSSSKQRVGSVV